MKAAVENKGFKEKSIENNGGEDKSKKEHELKRIPGIMENTTMKESKIWNGAKKGNRLNAIGWM